ncbi:hypothetical protein [Cyanobium sp. NIES-981]|uniref:hypothetical protein n=1 Tax=Cyanobium sp. NIES-981 TaxID=1851505 RepID=UPI0007DD6C6C|nr:hypothetical protein [Cyanobium sp. NIES-981]SBO43656.1 conserved membrane protein of unknown function [Cyanobium sp. NIES-981]
MISALTEAVMSALLSLLRILVLPFRAPMLLLLAVIAVYEGLHWGLSGSAFAIGGGQAASSGAGAMDAEILYHVFWSIDCLHALMVVVVCTMPELMMRRLSELMAASRVVTLVLTLLLVTVGGLYLLHLKVLGNMLILASAVLLARLDLARLRIVPPAQNLALAFATVVLLGAAVGRWLAGAV